MRQGKPPMSAFIGGAIPLLLATALWGQPLIGPVTLSPTVVPANTPTQVKVTVLITDTSLIAGSVNLLRLDSSGKAIATLGTLHDDGLSGDAVAGDNILTLVLSVNEPAAGRIGLKVSAAFRGVLQRPFSSTVSLDVSSIASPLAITATATPPPNAKGWNNKNVTVSFACSGGSGSEICPGTVLVSNDGAGQVISGTAKDAAGNMASKSITINLDKTPPTASISSPSSGATLTNPALVVTGIATDATAGIDQVTCNGVKASIDGSNFTCNLTLVLGSNTISVQATDIAGNTATSKILVTLAPPLALTISAGTSPPPNSATWNNTNITVTFTCSGGVGGVASCPQPVVVSTEGANQVISGTAKDQAGNSASTSVTLNIDKTQPSVKITSPADGSIVTTAKLDVTGTATDPLSGVAKVSCNGSAAVLTSSAFSCNVILVNGLNTISAQATDVAGNVATANIKVTLSGTSLPTITDFNPKSAPVGTLINVAGTNLQPNAGTAAQVNLVAQGAGTIAAPVSSTSATSIAFVIPPGAATGLIAVKVNAQP